MSTKRISLEDQNISRETTNTASTATAADRVLYTTEGDQQVLTFHSTTGEEPTVLKFATKSEMFRLLAKNGSSVGDIAALTGSHYSFVYGIVSAANLVTKKVGDHKSDKIRELAAKGLTPGQIATALNSNYSFVHSVVKKYKADLAAAK